MVWRVKEEEVREVIDSDDSIRIAPFIDTANTLTDKISSRDSSSLLSSAELKAIELNLAAHFYAQRDTQYSQERTADASGVVSGQFGENLSSTYWGQNALLLDETGYLQGRQKSRRRAVVGWLGLPPSEQTDYVDRD